MNGARIYVSSTYEDLREYRSAVSKAIKRLEHVDVAMEYYVPESRRPLAKCLDDVRRCDLYLGIFARRYGYMPPGESASITELEFREALRRHIDTVCFLLDTECDWPAAFIDSGEAGARIEALRAEIARDYLAGFFATPDEIGAVATAAIVRALDMGRTPFDAEREHRLMKQWRHGKLIERGRARQALANMGSPRYAAALKERLLEGGKPGELDEFVIDLAELVQISGTTRHVLPILVDLIEHDDAAKRQYAIFQLGELGLRGKAIDSAIVHALLARSTDPSAAVRAELAHTLGKIAHDDEALGAVRSCLDALGKDADDGVRQRAQESLDKLPR